MSTYRHKEKRCSNLWLSAAWLLLTGCLAPSPPPPPLPGSLTWPPPPAPARIAYEKSISKPADLGMRKSWLKSLGEIIIGNGRNDPVFARPTGLCIDEAGNVCVTDTGNASVWFFDLKRQRYKHWNHIGNLYFSSPVAVAKYHDTLYVADSGLGSILAFSLDGKLLFKISEGIERPSGLVIHDQTLWVTDSKKHQVLSFDLKGRKIAELGVRGTAAGEFNFPTHITADSEGSLYITDSMNFRIQKIDKQGNPLQIFGSQGNVSGSFNRPKGVAADREGNIYAVDALFENVQVFDKQGRFLMHWGANGAEPGNFWLPAGIALGAQNRIWIADSYNRRIQVFKRINHHEEN